MHPFFPHTLKKYLLTSQTKFRQTQASQHSAIGLLCLLCLFALAIRLTHLASKPAWMDEVATTLFSLGNYSRLIPLNQIISLEQVLRPLHFTPGATAQDVVRHLLLEDNHPPTYFVLAYGWMALFHRLIDPTAEYASLWAARALPAFFGALTVPATYLLAWMSFKDRLICWLCALLMALSPFGVFMAQEARHYSLAILAVIASLCCFVMAVQALQQRQPLAWGSVMAWIGINTFGLTVHFFFGLTLLAEGMTLAALLIWTFIQPERDRADLLAKTHPLSWRSTAWCRIYIAATGTLAGALLWLPILLNFYGSPQTSFLKTGTKSWQYWVNPIVQSLASWLYAIFSPITRGYSWQMVAVIVVTCVLLLLGYAPWLIANLQRGLRLQIKEPTLRTGIQAMGGFLIMANALFLMICYGLGFDITRGHRYSFVFFPSIVILVGVSLAPFWRCFKQDEKPPFSNVKLPLNLISRRSNPKTISGRAFVATVLIVSFLGTQVIVNNLSNLKFYSADRFVKLVQETSTLPVVIGTNTTVTAQPSVIGIELMSVAWEIQRHFNPKVDDTLWVSSPQFVIAENNTSKDIEAETQLVRNLHALPRPFDLWLLNMSLDLGSEHCHIPTDGGGNKGSFSYTHYVCKGESASDL